MIGSVITLSMVIAAASADPSPACRDGQTADQAITAVYDLVSVQPGQGWDWDRLGDLFVVDGLFVTMTPRPSGALTTVATLPVLKAQTETAFAESGFTEREYRRQTRVFGDIASIYSSFYVAIPPSDRPTMRGLHHFQLVRKDGCWRVVSNISHMEGVGWRLPNDWEPASIADESRLLELEPQGARPR